MSVVDAWILNQVSGVQGLNLNFVRVVRIFRVTRLGRVVRVLRIFHELRVLVDSILGSFQALAWTVLFLFIIMGVCAIFISAVIAQDWRSASESWSGSDEE